MKALTQPLLAPLSPQQDEVSMLNFEHSAERPGQFKGTAAILQKLQSLPFQQARGFDGFASSVISSIKSLI